MFKYIWAWLQGKKTTIGIILASTNAYLFASQIYDEKTMIWIGGILVALGLTANIANAQSK